jgi:hypothetical protein
MADNPEEGTTENDGSIESASQAILDVEEKDEEGYETQRPETSKSQETEAEAEAEDGDADEEVEDEDESEPQRYTVKVDGKEVDVTLDELQSGYIKQSDYTKKTSELAEQRKAMVQEAQAIQQERNQYAQALGQMQTETEKQLGEYKQIDWDQLREQDPMLFMQRRDEMRDLEKSIEDGHKQQQQLSAQAQQYQVHKFNADVEHGRDKLLAVMPDWDDKVSKSVREFGLNEGFSSEELSGITDHRSMAVLRKAMMYDAIQKAQPAKKKVRSDTPKYVKSGVAKSKGDVSARKRSDKTKQLKRSGAVDDAASMIYDML